MRDLSGLSRVSTSTSSDRPPRLSKRRRLKPSKLKSVSNACLEAGLSSESSLQASGAPPFLKKMLLQLKRQSETRVSRKQVRVFKLRDDRLLQ